MHRRRSFAGPQCGGNERPRGASDPLSKGAAASPTRNKKPDASANAKMSASWTDRQTVSHSQTADPTGDDFGPWRSARPPV